MNGVVEQGLNVAAVVALVSALASFPHPALQPFFDKTWRHGEIEPQP